MAFWEFLSFDTTIYTALAILAVLLLVYHGLKQHKNLPPGPMNLPLIGNLPIFMFNLHRSGCDGEPEKFLAKMAKQCGNVLSLKLGTQLYVFVNGYKSIKEAFQNPYMDGRQRINVFEEASIDKGIVNTEGKSWKYQRNILMSAFHNFGKSTFERNVTEEAKTLVYAMHQHNGTAFNPRIHLEKYVTNVLSSFVLGKPYDLSDPEFERLLVIIRENVAKADSGSIVIFVPFMRHIFPKLYKNVRSSFLSFASFYTKSVEEHQRKFDKSNKQDIIDIFLNEIEAASKESTDRKDFIHMKSLIGTVVMMYIAGTETTTITLQWVLIYIMMNPDVQIKVQQEIDTVVGRDRMPQWSDKSDLPYTEAVLLEVQRIRTVVPFGVPHKALEDTILAGYDIPKGALVIANLWGVQNDLDVWDEPDQFKPERFLDENGKILHREECMSFSTGHRDCLGANLALMEMFLFFTHTLHTFTIKNPTIEHVTLEPIGLLTRNPVSYKVIAEKRD